MCGSLFIFIIKLNSRDEKRQFEMSLKRRRSLLGSLREKQLGQPRQRRIYPPLCSPSCARLLHSEAPKRLRRHCAQVTCAAVLPDGTLDGGANNGGNGGDTTVVLSADGGGWVLMCM